VAQESNEVDGITQAFATPSSAHLTPLLEDPSVVKTLVCLVVGVCGLALNALAAFIGILGWPFDQEVAMAVMALSSTALIGVGYLPLLNRWRLAWLCHVFLSSPITAFAIWIILTMDD
jgi:hypothetical protein